MVLEVESQLGFHPKGRNQNNATKLASISDFYLIIMFFEASWEGSLGYIFDNPEFEGTASCQVSGFSEKMLHLWEDVCWLSTSGTNLNLE